MITSATPVIVPPVPTPATRMSTLPSVSFQISSAVVLRWISGLAGLLNCWGMKEFGVAAASSSALLDGAVHPFRAGRQHQLGPEDLQQLPPLHAHGLGHGEDQPVAPGRADEGQRDARVAAGGLDDHRVLLEQAALLGRLDHGHADAVLDAGQRVEGLQLDDDLGLMPSVIRFSLTRGVRPTVLVMSS